MSSPRRLLAPECDVQRLHVSFNVGGCWRELERKAWGDQRDDGRRDDASCMYSCFALYNPMYKFRAV
eukprot:scaffold3248_cov92-Phaeocystis_antarctica.AAC.2